MTDTAMSRIYAGHGSFRGVFDLDLGALLHFGLKKDTASSVVAMDIDTGLFKNELKALEKLSGRIICIDDKEYPDMLSKTESAPPVLFVRGDISAFSRPAVAVVGSRKASRAACDFSRRLGSDLAEAGFNVVSGFASGIDIYAHTGAMKKGLTTAVMGCGIGHIFPEVNRRYLPELLENGCAVTEFFSSYPPMTMNFPRRNRIISGMSYGVAVVEASERSGSLITARLAGEQGRDVFAVPAFPDNRNSATNSLLKQGAILVESYFDIVDELKYQISGLKEVDKQDHGVLEFDSPEQTKLFDLLLKGTLNPDELSAMSELDIESVVIHLAQMELEGYVIREIDGKYRAAGGLNGQNSHSSQPSNRLSGRQ